MKKYKTWKITLISLFICFILLGLFAAYRFIESANDRDNSNVYTQQEMLKTIMKSGNLAPIPKSAKIRSIKTEGSMFTRSFRLTFDSDVDTIHKWLYASHIIKSTKNTAVDGMKKYVLNVKDGYSYGEINVDYKKCTVAVYVSHG